MPERPDPDSVDPEVHHLTDDGTIPNNPDLPALLHREAMTPPADDPARGFEELFTRHGWAGSWRNGIYDFHHFHSTAHEVLGIARGRARVRLGGESGVSVELSAGDVVVLPAGTGHRNEGASPDLLVVGAYPDGQSPDLCRGRPDERPRVLANIAAVPLPAADPVRGRDGPLPRLWRSAR